MTEFLASFFTALAGGGIGIGIILLGFGKYLGGIWSKRIDRLENNELEIKTLKQQSTIDNQAREHTAELEERLKELEQEHKKLLVKDEQFHQISQETYQKAFETKMNTYTRLFSLSHKIEKAYPHLSPDISEKLLSGKNFQIDDILLSAKGSFVVESYANFIKTTDDNLTFLSQEALDAYFVWQDAVNLDMQKNNSLNMSIMSKLIDSTNDSALNSNVVPEMIVQSAKISKEELNYQSKLREALIYHNHFDTFENLKLIIREDVRVINQRVENAFK